MLNTRKEAEDVNDTYSKMEKINRIFFALTILFALLTLICLAAGFFVKEDAYRTWTEISSEKDNETRMTSYIRAINLCPEKTDAYLLLLDTCNEDGVFSEVESEKFLSLHNRYYKKISTHDKQYAKLHYQAGFIYITGYDKSAAVRLKMAVPFFKRAAEHLDTDDANAFTARSFYSIGQYYQDYVWDMSSPREVPAEEMFALTEEIRDTILVLQESTTPEVLYNSLGFYEAVCNFLYGQRDILATAVPQDTVLEILDLIYTKLPDIEILQGWKVTQKRNDLLEREEMYREMIHRAYQ